MTLTVVVGSSGSGKTYLLNETNATHPCLYIRQYHSIRPYVTVSKIPDFDPTRLPFWELYERGNKGATIQAGGALAGEFVRGFSGGQRKMLLFEIVCQRTANQSNLLLLLDEPFSGVTEDFVPFIQDRLETLRKRHNVVLVTNDHIDACTEMADNVLLVSALDRSHVVLNDTEKIDRQKAILALSTGEKFVYETLGWNAIDFFVQVEVIHNPAVLSVFAFLVVSFGCFLLGFWDSTTEFLDLVVLAAGFVDIFAINSWIIALAEWRDLVTEEAQALVHASRSTNIQLKIIQTVVMSFFVCVISWGVLVAVVDDVNNWKVLVGFYFDHLAVVLPYFCFALHTNMNPQNVELVASLYILFVIFFSSSFSPGGGLPGIKGLRYLFSRFYFWCILDIDGMEGCPEQDSHSMAYLILTAFVETAIFLAVKGLFKVRDSFHKQAAHSMRESLESDEDFIRLKAQLYGDGREDGPSDARLLKSNTSRLSSATC